MEGTKQKDRGNKTEEKRERNRIMEGTTQNNGRN